VATKTEKLVVRKLAGYNGMKGYYPFAAASDHKLVCIRGDVKVIMKQVRFEAGIPGPIAKAWQGKRNVKVTLRHSSYQDVVMFPDGMLALLTSIKEGVRIDIGIPVKQRKARQRNLAKLLGLDQIRADVPASRRATIKD